MTSHDWQPTMEFRYARSRAPYPTGFWNQVGDGSFVRLEQKWFAVVDTSIPRDCLGAIEEDWRAIPVVDATSPE